MTMINLRDAKAQLSELVDRAAAGEEIIICKAGKPMARLVACVEPKVKRKPGAWKGKVRILPGFYEVDEGNREDV